MAIRAESIVAKATAGQIREALAAYLEPQGYEPTDSNPVRSVTAPVDFPKKKRRYFFLLDWGEGLRGLVEIGGVADRGLARFVSSRYGSPVYWLSLHEDQNAWGLVRFENGDEVESELHPRHLYETDGPVEDYDGDAADEAYDATGKLGGFDPFATYYQLANDLGQPKPKTIVHVAFKRS